MKTMKIALFALALGLMSFHGKPFITEPFYTVADSVVAWKSDNIDIGEIPQNKPRTIVFEFVNKGKTDIVITNVKPTCGCTTSDYTKTIMVTTSAEEAPKALTFKGTVI